MEKIIDVAEVYRRKNIDVFSSDLSKWKEQHPCAVLRLK
jgi:hypothetical protein